MSEVSFGWRGVGRAWPWHARARPGPGVGMALGVDLVACNHADGPRYLLDRLATAGGGDDHGLHRGCGLVGRVNSVWRGLLGVPSAGQQAGRKRRQPQVQGLGGVGVSARPDSLSLHGVPILKKLASRGLAGVFRPGSERL